METVQSSLLVSVCWPGFSTVEQDAENAGLVHSHSCSDREVAVHPDAISSSVRERESLIVEPRYVNLCTRSSSVPAMLKGLVGSCPWLMVTVFFRLMVSPKLLQDCSKVSSIFWRSHSVRAQNAASSAYSSSMMLKLLTFVFALSRERLKNFPSLHVVRVIPLVGGRCLKASFSTVEK